MRLAAVITFALLAVIGCATTGEPAQSTQTGDTPVESPVLSEAFVEEFTRAVLALRERDPQAVPEDWTDSTFLPRMIEAVREQNPQFLKATAKQEAAWAAGEFDDVATWSRIASQIDALQEAEFELPWLVTHFIRRFHEGELQGARLVVAEQLLAAYVSQVPDANANDL